MLNTISPVKSFSPVEMDERNRRLVVNGYEVGTKPVLFGRHLIYLAAKNKLEKIWLWALPADVPEFIRCGFRKEGSLFFGNQDEFAVSLAYFVLGARGHSQKLHYENQIVHSVRTGPIRQSKGLPSGTALKLLGESSAAQISQLLTQVFKSYPSPVESAEYIRSLMQKGNIFAGAFSENNLLAVAAAYPDPVLKRCEMTDCATKEEFRGKSLSEHLLRTLENEVQKLGTFSLYTLARAKSYGMNRVFYKLGYKYQGRLINNCHIAGAYEDMNLWIR